ncbi:MAG: AAA family ATPase [Cytophagales bacterium]|nr:AAA family ATPase [Cytophagales bacterium]
MITRIKIDGFKSLLNTELYFGPFTCIAGANAIGKSNFFDALSFLSKLADNTILYAAKSIRSEEQKHSDIKDIFFKSGKEYYEKMSFEIDMLVSKKAEDDLGQDAEASITSLRYSLELKLNLDNTEGQPIQIIKEELRPITLGETKKGIHFERDKNWVNSVVLGKKTTAFITTLSEKIKLHQDGNKGRTTEFIAEKMPRTLLSTVTSESPTAFLARQEMRNWIMLQFEPSALRQPNSTYEVKNAEITANGSNLPATLYRLHTEKNENDVYQKLTNKLKSLVNDVDEINVDKDEKRDLLTLQIKFKDGLVLPAQSLSDGTLRFLGLAIIQEDNKSSGLICLEEPENGINPKKVNEMVNLLEDMATDTAYEVNEDNPLRQVIINSHSPLVVRTVSAESLYLATEREVYSDFFQKKIKHTKFSALNNTWKTDNYLIDATTIGDIICYLDNSQVNINKSVNESSEVYKAKSKKKRTVAESINQLNLQF